jgi:hypothetical protein
LEKWCKKCKRKRKANWNEKRRNESCILLLKEKREWRIQFFENGRKYTRNQSNLSGNGNAIEKNYRRIILKM